MSRSKQFIPILFPLFAGYEDEMKKEGLQHTAIVVFTRTAKAEARMKSLSFQNNRQQSIRIFEALNNRVLELASNTNLPVILGNETLQKGHSFGEKLMTTLQYAFDQGYERLIVVGNDCLELTVDHIQLAASQLDHHELVLGPALDGGVYLMGVTQSILDKVDFLGLPWQTSRLFNRLIEITASKEISFACLDEAEDVDDAIQFVRLLNHLPGSYALKWLLNLLFSPLKRIHRLLFLLVLQLDYRPSPLRAPPAI